MPTPRPYGGVSAAERAATRRDSLLESCRAVIGREGVAAVTVEAVCAESALGKRYFYESFAARDDLLLAVAEEFYVGLLDRMSATIAALEPDARPTAVVRLPLVVFAPSPAGFSFFTRGLRSTTGGVNPSCSGVRPIL